MEAAFVLLMLVTAVSGCGEPSHRPDTSRVVNGVEARPHSWPWQVSLESFYPTCGGSLIAANWVLTAAHCITFHTYRVVLAEHDMSQEEGPEQSIRVEKMILHPQWNDNCPSCGSDIALLKLERSAVISDKVQLACLPKHQEVLAHMQPCYVTGWGRLYTGGPRASRLQQARLPVVEHSVCSRSDWWGSSAKTTMVCAGGESESACHGDSGGPLNCQGRDGRWYVQGVTSFVDGRGCNTLKKPTVFTRVASFIPWITEVRQRQLQNHR
ncbi:chymotrypsin-like elastase family member 3B isoform X1 [Synchiropus splendidus]|uniref:chymotrypsin-like elastase family member 3B isoform X1 n=1 Tax=Synchiropus splendidus TaxID=270530 RepID=UPI00237D55FD|nr:chymotrypsin-like elastase family member 3B isoform X1 [Synchiropus splendidus]